MDFVPSARDETLALSAATQTSLDESERDVCTVIALAAKARVPVFPETMDSFHVLLARTHLTPPRRNTQG